MAADNREATPWHGACWTFPNAHEVEHTHPWVELDNNEEDSRGERNDTVWRRRFRSAAAGKTSYTEGYG
jgi:hypothetical protein